MTRHPTQIGGSSRGPRDLDTAKQNAGAPPDQATFDEDEAGPLSSGETTEEAERRAREAEEQEAENIRKPARGPVPVRGPDEEDEMEAARSDQPGGDRPSESERPTGPGSRWGRGPGGKK